MISVSCPLGIGTHTASFTLLVGGAFDYTVAWSPTSATVVAGSGTTPNVVATLTSGSTTSVTCTVTVPVANGLAASPLSFSITPAVAPGATQAIAITTTTSTPSGSYSISVSCTLGIGTHTATFNLVIGGAFDYTVAWSPTSATVVAGSGTTPNVVATLTSGTTTAVSCTVTVPVVTGLAASPLSFSITPAVAPGATQAIAITTTTSTPAGIYSISVSCTLGIGTHNASFSLTVNAAFNYTVAWSPTSAAIVAGSSTTPNVVATLTSGTAASIACTVTVPVATGLAASPLSFSITPTTAGATQTVMISTTVFTSGGTYIINVSCTGGIGTHTANFTLTVTPANFDYTVAWSPSSATITAGSSTTPNVVATLTSGTTTAVSCTVTVPVATGLAASPLSFSITPAVAPGATQAIAISTTTSTPAGSYTISVSCTLGIGSHTASFVLTVQSPSQDTDGDGIFDSVDTQPTVFSNDFSPT